MFLPLSGPLWKYINISLGKEVHGAELGKGLYFNKFRTVSWVYFIPITKEGTSRINWCGLWFPITLNWPTSQSLDTQYFLKPGSFKASGGIKPSVLRSSALSPGPSSLGCSLHVPINFSTLQIFTLFYYFQCFHSLLDTDMFFMF